jgi:glycerol-3-phosphate dehydrogenase
VELIRRESPDNSLKLMEGLRYERAHIIYYIRHQNVQKISDVLSRRLSLTYRMKELNTALVEEVADIMQKELGWTTSTREERIWNYQDHWKTLHSWTK